MGLWFKALIPLKLVLRKLHIGYPFDGEEEEQRFDPAALGDPIYIELDDDGPIVITLDSEGRPVLELDDYEPMVVYLEDESNRVLEMECEHNPRLELDGTPIIIDVEDREAVTAFDIDVSDQESTTMVELQ